MRFKQEFSLQKRKEESNRVLQKYPDRLPIICEKSNIAPNDCPNIDKKKYLVPKDLTVGHFLYVIRNRLKLGPEKAIFLFVGNIIPPSAACMNDIYIHHSDNDGFLYMTYSPENVFG